MLDNNYITRYAYLCAYAYAKDTECIQREQYVTGFQNGGSVFLFSTT